MTTTRSRKQTSQTAFSCPTTHLVALHGFNFSQQHIAEPVSNAAAWFSCTPWQIFNEDLQARGCKVGRRSWWPHHHRSPQKVIRLPGIAWDNSWQHQYFLSPTWSKQSSMAIFPYFPHKLSLLHMLQSSFAFPTAGWTHLNREAKFHHHSVLIAPLARARNVYLPHKQAEATFNLVTLGLFSILWQSKNSASPPEQVNNYSDIHKSGPREARPALQCSHCRKTPRQISPECHGSHCSFYCPFPG